MAVHIIELTHGRGGRGAEVHLMLWMDQMKTVIFWLEIAYAPAQKFHESPVFRGICVV